MPDSGNSMDDVELVRRAMSGQPAAFSQLVRKYQDRVFNACWRICGHYEDAADVTQNAFIKAYQNLSGFRRESAFYTWLFRIAVNLSLSHKRSVSSRRTTSLDAHEETFGTQAEKLTARATLSAPDQWDKQAQQAEAQSLIVRALHALDDDHRAVVVLRDIEGFDYQEIGHILNIPTGTVKSRLSRGRMALRAAVALTLGFDSDRDNICP